METFNSTDLNFSDSAIEHFSKVLKERGKGIGIKLGIKEAGCSGYEYTFDFVDDIIDDFITKVINSIRITFENFFIVQKLFYKPLCNICN